MGTETLGSGEDFDYTLREMPLASGGGGVGWGEEGVLSGGIHF